MLSEAHRAWLGAWIDGEGSIMLNKRTFSGNGRQDAKLSKYAHYRTVVVVACFTYEPLGVALGSVVSGQIYQHRAGGGVRTPRKRSQWTFRWNVGQIAEYLPQVRPWLVIKSEQADLVLEALRIKGSYKPGSRERDVIYREQLERIYLRIRELNTRGREVEHG